LKVYIRLKPPGRGFGFKVLFAFFSIALISLIGWSEFTRNNIQTDFENRSRQIWSAYTLLAAAESDYQNTQWNSEAHLAEAEATLRRSLVAFGDMRSRIERDEWKRLKNIVTDRFSVRRESQTTVVDYAFNEQMKVLRGAIERTDQLEQSYIAGELDRTRSNLYFRLALLLGVALIAFLAYWRLTRRTRRRRMRRMPA
jgi:hypothetical protein